MSSEKNNSEIVHFVTAEKLYITIYLDLKKQKFDRVLIAEQYGRVYLSWSNQWHPQGNSGYYLKGFIFYLEHKSDVVFEFWKKTVEI